VMHSL